MSIRPSRFTDGILLIDKPSGCTSFDVVKKIKRVIGRQKVGHTGTLDPLATGLLPVCIGEATKIAGLLTGQEKRYRARLRLGVATDTLDREGRQTETAPVPILERKQILDCLSGFTGVINQIPPMYSAIRHQGKRMYQLARSGVRVERAARRVEISSIELVNRGDDWLELDIRCGSGTYIRSLASDIAGKLSTVGHLEELVRTETAGWTLDQAHTLDRLDPEGIEEALMPVHEALERFTRVDVGDDIALRLAEGRRLPVSELQQLGITEERGAEPFWFCPPAKAPLILARMADKDGRPGMEIIRVLFPLQKNC